MIDDVAALVGCSNYIDRDGEPSFGKRCHHCLGCRHDEASEGLRRMRAIVKETLAVAAVGQPQAALNHLAFEWERR